MYMNKDKIGRKGFEKLSFEGNSKQQFENFLILIIQI